MPTNRKGQTTRISSGTSHSTHQPGALGRGYEAAERCITHYPASAVGLAFGAGIGLGLCVGLALKSAFAEPRSSYRGLTERLGRQVLDTLSGVLPESVSSRISR